ncbi:hypothetical protein BDN72DRAFT_955704 [Pluteus cervinus]|uniref:Uncharacterized protein n=1 Tax=Pluteus cervinus TaxID=181527 RepID=A0ACD3B944_9AGAR|nr:hypothetical protein BDN72DRAFT_955704 [Pluteus cervinus]
MPSFWSFSTRALSKNAAFRPSISFAPPVNLFSRFSISPTSRPSLFRAISSATLLKPQHTDNSINTSNSNISPPLPPPQSSRTAAKAVRSALQTHNLDQAYTLVNDLRYSGLRERHQSERASTYHGSKKSQNTYLPFSGDISPRLPAHCLLHGLIRLGLTKKASVLATEMMSGGLRLHRSSLDLLISKLSAAPSPSLLRKNPPKTCSIVPARTGTLFKLVGQVKSKGTRDALKLLLTARQYRQHRTDGMYELLLCACIINGEIILASLLFGLYLRETQFQHKLTGCLDSAVGIDSQVATIGPLTRYTRSKDFDYRCTMHFHNLLYPIGLVLSKSPSATNAEERTAAIQTLANLAMLLQTRQLSISAISPLLRILYDYAPSDVEVVVRGVKGELKTVNAYSYFQSVLSGLIKRLPSSTAPVTSSGHNPTRPQDNLIPLSLESYNSLLHYALRHRFNPTWGLSILDHMTTKRQPPLKPDTTTFNILLRSGTLLRRNDISQMTLQHFAPLGDSNPAPPEPFSAGIVGLKEARWESDNFTLNAYLSYLNAIGRPDLVLDMLLQLFPGFLDALKPPYSKDPPQQWLDCGVQLGPYFFTIAITALRNHGRFFVATCFWKVAKHCEQASNTDSADGEPWYLPVHAYTTMIQAHLAQAKCIAGRANRLSFHREKRSSNRLPVAHLIKAFKKLVDCITALYRELKERSESRSPKVQLDARLFNAVLNTLAPGPSKPLHQCAEELGVAEMKFANQGVLPDKWTPILHEVGQDIVKNGHALPSGLLPLYVGRWVNCNAREMFKLSVQSRTRTRFSTLRIPTRKTRGLYVWRRTRRRRRVCGEVNYCLVK